MSQRPVGVSIKTPWRRQQEITLLPIPRIIMAKSNISIRDNCYEEAKEDSLPVKRRHVRQVWADNHSAAFRNKNIKSNVVEGVKFLGNNTSPCKDRHEVSSTFIPQMPVTNQEIVIVIQIVRTPYQCRYVKLILDDMKNVFKDKLPNFKQNPVNLKWKQLSLYIHRQRSSRGGLKEIDKFYNYGESQGFM